jgi:hypothetical protein
MSKERKFRHLDPEDFFLLALPPAGEPEALPSHLSVCGLCARQLAEWQNAARALGALEGAPSEQFERVVMERVRGSRKPSSHRAVRRIRSVLAVAACLAGAFYLGTRKAPTPRPPAESVSAAPMTEADRADDELLRDVSRLVSDEDAAPWKSLAPLPGPAEDNS